MISKSSRSKSSASSAPNWRSWPYLDLHAWRPAAADSSFTLVTVLQTVLHLCTSIISLFVQGSISAHWQHSRNNLTRAVHMRSDTFLGKFYEHVHRSTGVDYPSNVYDQWCIKWRSWAGNEYSVYSMIGLQMEVKDCTDEHCRSRSNDLWWSTSCTLCFATKWFGGYIWLWNCIRSMETSCRNSSNHAV
jgi:hypothetical protein